MVGYEDILIVLIIAFVVMLFGISVLSNNWQGIGLKDSKLARVGYSELGVNRKRVDLLKRIFNKKVTFNEN